MRLLRWTLPFLGPFLGPLLVPFLVTGFVFGVAASLAGPGYAEEDDARTAAFKRYRLESVRPAFNSADSTSEERVIALRGLDKYGCPAAARWLILEVLAKSDEGDVLREVTRLLTRYSGTETTEEMARYWGTKLKKNIRARVLLTLAMGPKRNDASRALLRLALKHKDARIVAAACRTVGKGDDDTFKPALIAALRHKESLVRSAAVIALADLAEFDAKPQMFQLFCTDKSKFVRYRAWQALRKLEKDNRLPCETQKWLTWWEKQKNEWAAENPDAKNVWGEKFPAGTKNVKAARWFGIPVLADRIVFVLDATQRMDQGWSIDPLKERAKPVELRTPNFFSVKTRYALSIAHLKRALKELPDKTQVAVVLYHDKVLPPNHSIIPETGKWLKLSKRTRAQLIEAVKEYEPGGTSSLYEGMAAAYAFQGSKRPVKLGAQMICFLTNGSPTGGAFKNRGDRVKGELWVAAQTRGAVVHSVGLINHAYELLKDMAKESGGLYVHGQDENDKEKKTEPQDLEFWPDKKAAYKDRRAAEKKKKRSGK